MPRQHRFPRIATSAIAVLIHLAGITVYLHGGLRAAANLVIPAIGSLVAVWLVRIGDGLGKDPGRRPPRR
ncbi:hypothetical protein ABZ705_16745 [Streptomyces sp. NPDC006984]|uniref:hypothetical protein n=1 Tax=Streptomyces sp. NPDC006984 TaxID=3155463 RepID=UPI0033DCEF71